MFDSFATPWIVARQVPLSMGFSRQEYWTGLPFPSPGDLPDPGIEPESPTMAGSFFPGRVTGEAQNMAEHLVSIWFASSVLTL